MNPVAKLVHDTRYQGYIDINEDGVKNTLWLSAPRTRKTAAKSDADKLKNKLEV